MSIPRGASTLRLAVFFLAIAATPLFHAQAHAQIAPTLAPFANAPYLTNPNSLRFGAPVLFTGRILPADATGSIAFSIDSIPTQTVPLTPQTLADYVALGDSITYAGYIASPAQHYQSLLAQALNLSVSTYAASGLDACAVMPLEILPNNLSTAPATSPLSTLLIGAVDVANYGIGAHEALFNLCHQAALSWLAVPRTSKVLSGDSGLTIASGTWTAAPAAGSCCLNALTSTGAGTLRFTLATTGAPAYLWYSIQSASAGSFTVSVDGAPASAPTSTQYSSTVESFPSSYAMLRVPVSAGVHTFTIAAQTGPIAILGMGSALALAATPPVLDSDIPNQINGNAAAIAAYTADIQSNIALLHADGLDIRFVPTQQFMFATPAEMVDSTNPSPLGLSELAQAFAAAIAPAAPVHDSIAVAAASLTTATLPIGVHTIGFSYSGDTKYSPASAIIQGFTIYDGTSTATLTTTSSIFPTQTPITLTAAIPQPNASGAVTFVDITPSGNVALGTAWMNLISGGAAILTLASLSAGQHTLVAQYQGDAVYNASSSPTLAVTVSGVYTTTTLSAPATRYFAQSPVALTATVAPSTAAGTVAFLDGSTLLGQSPLVAGVATFSTASLASGIHSLTAAFSGNSAQDSSASPILSIEIDLNSTTVALAPIPAALHYGTAIALAASVSPSAATGSVTLNDSFIPLGQSVAIPQTLGQPTLVAGTATLNAASLAPGVHAVTALYSGDTNNLPSISSAVTTQITLTPTSIALAPIPATVVYGTAIALTASVTPAASTGSITFSDSISGTLTQIPVLNGSASFSTSTLTPGTHILSATYSGDSLHAASSNPPLTTAVTPRTASIALASPPPTIPLGTSLTLSATISPATAAGSVIFRDATRGILGESVVSYGAAALTLPSPSLGSWSITATYSGDTFDTLATSTSVATQIILTPTSTTLATNPATALAGAPVTFTTTIAPASATGIVTLFDGATAIASALPVNGSASLVTSSLAPGVHTLHATYAGDSLHAASTSASIPETITLSPTSTTLTLAQTSVIAGAIVTVNVRVATTSTTPAGTVSIHSGATILASAPIANAAAGQGYATLSVNSTALGLGTFPLAAFYSGDPADQPSDSTATPVAIAILSIPTAATLTLSSAQIAVQNSVTLTATLTAATPPTGSITFFNDGTPVATTPLNASGVASASIASLPLGIYALTATYAPTGLYASAAFAPQTLDVTPPLSLALSPSSIDAYAGSTVAATLVLTPLSGFTGVIQTLCQTTVSFVTCTVTAPSSIASATPLNLPVQIVLTSVVVNRATPTRPGASAATSAAVLALLLPFLTLRKSKRIRALRLLTLILCCALVSLFATGCGLGGEPAYDPPGTQTVAITVTAAGIAATATATINVIE